MKKEKTKKENKNEELKTEFKKRIYAWTLRLIKFTDSLPQDTSSKAIAQQLISSGAGVGSNYIEAQVVSSKEDSDNFVQEASKCANESKFWLAILRGLNRGKQEELGWLFQEIAEIINILGSGFPIKKGKKK